MILLNKNIKDSYDKLKHKILLMYKLDQICDDLIYTIGKQLIDEFNNEVTREPDIINETDEEYMESYTLTQSFTWSNINNIRYNYDLPVKINIISSYYEDILENKSIEVFYKYNNICLRQDLNKPVYIKYDYNDLLQILSSSYYNRYQKK